MRIGAVKPDFLPLGRRRRISRSSVRQAGFTASILIPVLLEATVTGHASPSPRNPRRPLMIDRAVQFSYARLPDSSAFAIG